MNLLFSESCLEQYCRRNSWTNGSPVFLADGGCWRLPHLSNALPGLMTELRGEFQAALDIAERHRTEAGTERPNLAELIRYHSHMAAIGCRLLQRNYDIPDCTWKSLLTFDNLEGMFRLTLAISFVLAQESDLWEPLLAAQA